MSVIPEKAGIHLLPSTTLGEGRESPAAAIPVTARPLKATPLVKGEGGSAHKG